MQLKQNKETQSPKLTINQSVNPPFITRKLMKDAVIALKSQLP
jgi:hypothetical protein